MEKDGESRKENKNTHAHRRHANNDFAQSNLDELSLQSYIHR